MSGTRGGGGVASVSSIKVSLFLSCLPLPLPSGQFRFDCRDGRSQLDRSADMRDLEQSTNVKM